MSGSIIHHLSLKYLSEIDPLFKQIIDQYGPPPSWSRKEGFETLCRIILEQQVSLESGKAAYEKLKLLSLRFTPQAISKLSIEEMRSVSITRQKSAYILGLANLIVAGELDLKSLSKKEPERAIERLIKVRGIGPWTAQVYALFALQAPDIYPKGDIALINTIKELWHVSSAEEALKKSSDWTPYRSAASFLLWHHYLSKRGRVSPI